MTPIKFPECNTVIGKNQPQYRPLPAHRNPDGEMITCWKFSWRERIAILLGRPLWAHTLTFGHRFQPVKYQFERPFPRKPA